MAKEKQYWLGLDELEGSAIENEKEFGEDLPALNSVAETISTSKSGRRDFLKMLGFSVTAAAVAASCEVPVRKSIPYVIKPEEITPGMPNYYATACVIGGHYNSVLVKTREGRPIMLEGNKQSKVSKGGVNAKSYGSLLGLYDNNRIQNPMIDGEKTDWKTLDKEIEASLTSASNIAILSNTIISPTTKAAVAKFSEKYPSAKLVEFDGISYDGLLEANLESFGKRAIPSYHFDKAELIVSIGADFLGAWLSPTEYAADYGKGRKVTPENPSMSRHIQIESLPTLAGSNADLRIPVKASEEDLAVVRLYNLIASSKVSDNSTFVNDKLESVAAELKAAKGKAIVVSGSNKKETQLLVNAINDMLGNYGNSISWKRACYYKQGSDKNLNEFLTNLNAGSIDTVIVMSGNPAYSLGEAYSTGIEKATLTIDLSERHTETTDITKYLAPSHHYLESWGDAQPKDGILATIQPTIAPLFKTRQAEESLLAWSGSNESYYDFLQNNWKNNLLGSQNAYSSFDLLWANTVHDGESISGGNAELAFIGVNANGAAAAIVNDNNPSEVELKLYEKGQIGDGAVSDNPWMQELADPITRICWDNYLMANPNWVADNGLKENSKNKKYWTIKVKANGAELSLPVVATPGVPYGTLGVAYGYGRSTNGIHNELKRGASVYPLVDRKSADVTFTVEGWEKVDNQHQIAIVQQEHRITHKGLGGEKTRYVVKETSLDNYKENNASGNVINEGMGLLPRKEWIDHHLVSLYGGSDIEYSPKSEYGGAHYEQLAQGHHWGMGVDLNSCIGCGACVVACNAENNVPVVGHQEVHRAHDMNWLRIDKYHTGDVDNPQVTFQPLMCQHCDNAPCENVCPVAATNHSSEGLNQMTYNRCIGTRYCANNCPYKVRRFNWYDYQGADSFSNNEGFAFNNDFDAEQKRISTGDTLFDGESNGLGMHSPLSKMVLNPDVTVRSRGVIEKCSFCVQRIQLGKLDAKKGNRKLTDNDITTACQSACPTNAITFGDTNNPNSAVSKDWGNERAYGVIEEIHTLPSVRYLVKVRNQKESDNLA